MKRRYKRSVIRNAVENILINDKRARNDNTYLYIEVVRKLAPQLLYTPLAIAYKDDLLPSLESVTRSRRDIQLYNKALRADDNVQAARELKEKEYREYYGHGRKTHVY